jgi:histidinol-phosphate aminotransferase
MKELVLSSIQNMQGYVSGEQPSDTDVIKLNTNENPYDPPDSVLQALKTINGDELKKYPPAMGDDLRSKIAETYGLNRDGLLLGNGSDEILTMIMRACVSLGDNVAYPDPTYVLYKTLAAIQGSHIQTIAFDEEFDLAISDIKVLEAKVFFLANPNSPSGTMICKAKVKELAQAFNGLFVVDEAYVDFAEDNCLSLVEECDNVIVLRTMSKSFSLAGIRLGWAYAQPDLIKELAKVKDSYNVNVLTQKLALAVLGAKTEVDARVSEVKQTRDTLITQLQKLGWKVYSSQANFVWARPSSPAGDWYKFFKTKKLYVRYFANLPDYLRITIGRPEDMEILIKYVNYNIEGVL